MTDVKVLTVSGVGEGAAEELFTAALARVLENIEDPNTDPKARRTISLKFDFNADEERRVGTIEITCGTKLAGVRGHKVPVYFGRHQGRFTVVEGPKQAQLFDNTPARPRAVAAPGGKD